MSIHGPISDDRVRSTVKARGAHKYVPAMGFGFLTPFYDAFVRLFFPETAFKNRLVEQAGIRDGERVLDIGCGTATLTILAKRANPRAEVVGLDGDRKILEIARRKAAKAGVAIALQEGLASELPFADASFGRVLSSLMLHHLTPEDRRRALAEAFRVLRPGGELHAADFARPNTDLPAMLAEAGFEPGAEHVGYPTLFGEIRLWRARRP